LLDKIDLEPDMVDDVCPFPWNGYYRHQVDEWDTALSIVDQGSLTFFSGIEHTLQVRDCDIVGVLSFCPLDDFPVRCYGSSAWLKFAW
jgi:hypothetical protein